VAVSPRAVSLAVGGSRALPRLPRDERHRADAQSCGSAHAHRPRACHHRGGRCSRPRSGGDAGRVVQALRHTALSITTGQAIVVDRGGERDAAACAEMLCLEMDAIMRSSEETARRYREDEAMAAGRAKELEARVASLRALLAGAPDAAHGGPRG